jgi:hypothetical protein
MLIWLNEEFGEGIVIINTCSILFSLFFNSCFPHIVNLACKAALAAITDLTFVDETTEGYEDYEPSNYTKDCIATIRSFVNSVSDIDWPYSIVINSNLQVRNSNIKKQ